MIYICATLLNIIKLAHALGNKQFNAQEVKTHLKNIHDNKAEGLQNVRFT